MLSATLDTPQTPTNTVRTLWSALDRPAAALSHLTLTGREPVLPSSFAVGTASQASIAASALAAAELWHLRGGGRQQVTVDMRHAITEFRSERYFRVNGASSEDIWDKITGAYRCGDGQWVRIHANFPHHRDGVLTLLGCAHERASVERSLQDWTAEGFEDAAAQAGLVVAAMRSFTQWDQHPQGLAVQALPILSIEKIGEAPAQPLPAPLAHRPLDGVRVLDLTRIIAGPVCGRTLAAHGAEVLLVTAPQLPAIGPLVIDTGRGKRSCQIDLEHAAGRAALHDLLGDADIFVQGYRPGALAAHGFSPEAAAAQRPGIVYVSLSAYSHVGPWSERRGFDSLVQTASGFNHAEAEAARSEQPKPLPAQVLDHAAGYLMAYGAMSALARRITEGGSWHVRVSLAQTGQWLRQLGRIENGLDTADLGFGQVQDLLEQTASGFGQLTAVRHAAQMSLTPARWDLPSVALGTHAPAWQQR
jgi:crotonobetainyl-CoA:carnitine CoA-transferase CaiB-like acyl-CoA transferase